MHKQTAHHSTWHFCVDQQEHSPDFLPCSFVNSLHSPYPSRSFPHVCTVAAYNCHSQQQQTQQEQYQVQHQAHQEVREARQVGQVASYPGGQVPTSLQACGHPAPLVVPVHQMPLDPPGVPSLEPAQSHPLAGSPVGSQEGQVDRLIRHQLHPVEVRLHPLEVREGQVGSAAVTKVAPLRREQCTCVYVALCCRMLLLQLLIATRKPTCLCREQCTCTGTCMLHGCFLIPACSCCHCAPYRITPCTVQYNQGIVGQSSIIRATQCIKGLMQVVIGLVTGQSLYI